jgi:hypothetical protein
VNSKRIKAFVRRSIKADTSAPNIAELQQLLDQMSTTEIQQFWIHFASDRAFSVVSTGLPYWKTKQQEVCLQHILVSELFCPKEKDANGKYIVVRKDLEEHVKSHLLAHIQDRRRFEDDLKARPLFDKIRARIGLTLFVILCASIPIAIGIFVICGLFHVSIFASIATPAITAFMALYGVYLLMPLVRALLRKCDLWKDA